MIDFHINCRDMSPEEAARAAFLYGYHAIAINQEFLPPTRQNLDALRSTAHECSLYSGVEVFAAVKLAHVAPALLPDMTQKARDAGAQLVLVCGETIAPGSIPPAKGANLAAINAGADILATPGLITREEAELAAEKKVALEISLHPGHGLANGHIAAMARITGASLVFGSGACRPHDLLHKDQIQKLALGAAMTMQEIHAALENARALAQRILMCRKTNAAL